MPELTEHTVYCPYCGEPIHVIVDPEEVGQQYIEDCQVCCRPISFLIGADAGGEFAVSVYTEDDTI